jgi:hypothetical protein
VLQARLLGYGGLTYTVIVLGCLAKTIERAANELDGLPNDPEVGWVWALGGGRKKNESEPQLGLNLNSFVNIRTAGDPDQPDFK